MSERGEVIRSASALDPAIAYPYIYPYHVLPLPAIDRAISSTTDMNDGNKPATSEWVQLWRLSDLTLLKSFALPPGPRICGRGQTPRDRVFAVAPGGPSLSGIIRAV